MSAEEYTITPFGLLGMSLPELEARKAVEVLELYCRRHGKGLAVTPHDNRFCFVEMAAAEQPPADPLADHPELGL